MIEIRKAVPDDALAIQEIFHKTWLKTYPNTEYGITEDIINDHYKNAYKPETIEKRQKQILEMNDTYTIFTAKVDGKVVGFIRFAREKENNRLGALYILPDFQGKGIGTKLFENAETIFDKTKPTLVDVATYNTQAINFYKKIGFVDTGKRMDFKINETVSIPEMEMIKKPAL